MIIFETYYLNKWQKNEFISEENEIILNQLSWQCLNLLGYNSNKNYVNNAYFYMVLAKEKHN